MAIVKYQGIEIECSPEEAVQIIDRLVGGSPSADTGKGSSNGGGTTEDVQRVKNLFGQLQEKQQQFLRAIAEHSFGKTDKALFQELNLSGENVGKALGGTLSPIGRFAGGHGLAVEKLYTMKTNDGGGKEYRPTELLRAAGRAMGWTVN